MSIFGKPNSEFSVLHSSADCLYTGFNLPESITVVEMCVCSGHDIREQKPLRTVHVQDNLFREGAESQVS